MTYEDIRFYRSIARSQLRKDLASKKKLDEERKRKEEYERAQTSGGGGGWGSWLWGSSASSSSQPAATPEDPILGGPMTEEQRKQLYDVLDFDEKAAVADSLNETRDTLKARVVAKLKKGSFALRADPHGKATEIISVVFDVFKANFLQRPENFETSVSLGGFRIFDGTVENSLYSQIARVKDSEDGQVSEDDPFFFLNFEHKPLDDRADMGLTMRLRHMEIIYHRGYVESIVKFFKPPASQLESVEALLVSLISRLATEAVIDSFYRMLLVKLWKGSVVIHGQVWSMRCKHTRQSTCRST